jgi:membrane-associated PAP2 superfamily phosphatase
MNHERHADGSILIFSVAGFLASVALHYQRSIDWRIQGYLLNDGHWIVNDREPLGRLLFYNGPKAMLICFAGYVLVLTALNFRAQRPERWGYLYAFACMALVPIFIGIGKAFTNEPCPGELFVFLGSQHLGALHGECFPGGHASGGFALIHLYWCSSRRLIWLLPGLLFGTLMGGYQMAKGAHFLSDTTASLFIALIFCAGLARLLPNTKLRILR